MKRDRVTIGARSLVGGVGVLMVRRPTGEPLLRIEIRNDSVEHRDGSRGLADDQMRDAFNKIGEILRLADLRIPGGRRQ